MSHYITRRYGAIELKMAYQRNMTLAMIFIIIVTSAAVGGMHLFAEAASGVVIVPPEVGPIIIKADLAPLPNIVKPKSRIKAHPPRSNHPVVSSNLIPIDDDEFVDMDGGMLPTRDELYEIIDAGRLDNGSISGPVIIENTKDNYEKKSPVFTPCEFRPELIYSVEPLYPRQARMVGLTAVVWVSIHVDENGNALETGIYVSSGSSAGFDEAAMAAAMKCKFKPGIQNGIPVKAWVTLKFVFDLND